MFEVVVCEVPGDYEDIAWVISSIPTFAMVAMEEVPQDVAEYFAEVVKRRIETQDLPSNWFLKRRYNDRKKREGHDARILMETGQLLESIKAFRVRPGMWAAGVSADAGMHKSARYASVLVMDVLEQMERGTYNSPDPRPRPIIGDTMKREQAALIQLASNSIVRVAYTIFQGLVRRRAAAGALVKV